MGIFNTKMPDLLSLPLKTPAPLQIPQNFNLKSLRIEMPNMPKTLSTPVQDSDKTQYLKRAGQNLIGMDDGKWTRSEQRDFRKNAGMSRQDFRNWKAKLLLGDKYREGMDYSRGVIKGLEKGYSDLDLTNMYAKQYIDRVSSVYNLMYPQNIEKPIQHINAVPIQPLEIIEEPVEEEPITPYQVQYDLMSNNGMNNYWANQAQQVLGNLSPELLMEISGNDGTIDYNDAIAWLLQIGAGNDGKFGSSTIGAMNNKYGLNAMLNYKNPTFSKTYPNKKGTNLSKQIVMNATLSTPSLWERISNMLGNLIMSLR